MTKHIGIYTLRIMGPDAPSEDTTPYDWETSNKKLIEWDETNQKIIDDIGSTLSDAEQLVNDQLPEGYYCKIDET